MQFSYPIKISISELFEKLQTILEPRHISLGAVNCCRIFLVANGVSSNEFKFGKTEVHIRPGHQLPAFDASQLSIDELTKINQEFKFFMYRILKIRFKFLAKREYCLILIIFNIEYE